jgi:hypothetical protein
MHFDRSLTRKNLQFDEGVQNDWFFYHCPKRLKRSSTIGKRSKLVIESVGVVVEPIPVRVVEIVPTAVVEMIPERVVEIVPVLVVEIVPALVVEIVPGLASAELDIARTRRPVQTMG